jgi:hypothetical protein
MFAGGVLSLGPVFLGAQGPGPNPAPNPFNELTEQRFSSWVAHQPIPADGDAIVSLVRDAQKLEAAGDHKAALKTMALIPEVTKAWAANVQKKREVEEVTQDLKAATRLKAAEDALRAAQARRAKPDLEARIEQLENQVKRLADALERGARDGGAPQKK